MRILVVENDHVDFAAICRLLNRIAEPVEIIRAEHYIEMLEKLLEFQFDLIFLDVFIPQGNGISIAYFLSNAAKTKGVKIVVVSGVNMESFSSSLSSEVSFLEKPLKQEEIEKAICEAKTKV